VTEYNAWLHPQYLVVGLQHQLKQGSYRSTPDFTLVFGHNYLHILFVLIDLIAIVRHWAWLTVRAGADHPRILRPRGEVKTRMDPY